MTLELSQLPTKFTPQDSEWLNLILQIADGNESALSKLYDCSSRLVYGLALRILSNPSEAEEVALEVYMQVWETASGYDPSKGSPSAWLLILTRSRAIDRFRSSHARKFDEEYMEGNVANASAGPEETTSLGQQQRLIKYALSTLNPQQRRAIELAYFYGLSQSEIAKEMDQPLGTIKSWIRLGMLKLRDQLSVDEEETNGAA